MQILIGPLLTWLFRSVVVKFVILAAMFALLAVLVPFVVNQLAPFIAPTALTNAFAGIPPGVWWIVDLARVDIGAPMVIAAYVARFLIRRVPFLN